jgi:hypothetical protein
VKFRALVLQVGIGCVFLATLLSAQKKTFAPANDVSFKIFTASKTYRTGQSITLEYRVTNISHAPLFVPREWEVTCPGGPHLWGWLVDGSGKQFMPGFAGSCSATPQTIGERMSKEAVLLKPGGHLDGTFVLVTNLFGGLKPGVYRAVASLSGWNQEKFTEPERAELARMASPFMTGEVLDSVRVTLIPRAK